MDRQGLISYPGLVTFTRAEYVLSQGIAPGSCTIEMPQELLPRLQPSGDLTISYGDREITLYDCAVSSARIDRGLGGFIARVEILDRRWKWRFGFISGHYNLRLPTGSCADQAFNSRPLRVEPDVAKIRQGTEKSPRELAALCLQQMHEQNYDVSDLPNDPRPEINWSDANPAQALEELCDSLGCRVVLWLEDNSVHVVRVGEGNSLPRNQAAQWVSEGANPPQPPSALVLVGGPTIYQGFLPLRAVGIDSDGIKELDELNYKPPHGWSAEPLSFPSIADPAQKRLAELSVYRLWALDGPNCGSYIPFTANSPLPHGNIGAMQIRMYDRLLDTHNDPADPAKIVHKKPEVWGRFDSLDAQTALSSGREPPVRLYSNTRGKGNAVTVDHERWLVATADPLSMVVDGKRRPARLWVKVAYSLRDPDTWEPRRYTLERALNSGSDTAPRLVQRDDIFLKVIGTYDPSSFKLGTCSDNFQNDGILDEANEYLDAAQAEYFRQNSLDVPYAGIVPIQVDGVIQQVTYSIVSGPGGGAWTRASLATEHNPFVPPFSRRAHFAREQSERTALKRSDAWERHLKSDGFPL